MENLDDEKPSDKELLDQLCSSLPQRTHEDKCWADVGILQHQRQEKRSLESEKVQVTTTTSQSLRGRAAPPKKEKSNKVEKAEGVDLQVSWTVAVKKAVSDGPHVLSEKEDTEAFHEKLVQETETAQAAADLFQNFLESQAPKAVKPKASSKPQGDKPAAEEPGKDEPVPKRRLTTKGQPGK
eukprot:s6528_g6.t1